MNNNSIDSILNKFPIILSFLLIVFGLILSFSIDNYFFITISAIGIVILYKNRKKKE